MKLSLSAVLAILVVNTILIGLCVFATYSVYNRNKLLNTSRFVVTSGVPVSIAIPKLALQKEVIPGIYNSTLVAWNVSDSAAQYATISQKPNNVGGTTVIYAHNTNQLFGKIETLSKGDTVEITTKNHKKFVYQFEEMLDVTPTTTSIFSVSGKPRLALLTCTGRNNSLRKIVYFTLSKII